MRCKKLNTPGKNQNKKPENIVKNHAKNKLQKGN